MSENLNDKAAWAWYDLDTLELRHVGFNPKADYGSDLGIIAMNYESACDIMSGKSRLFEYELTKNNDNLIIAYKKRQMAFKKFWQLIDPEKLGVSSYFDSVNGNMSPVVIKHRNDNGFVVDVVGRAKNIVFYITMRNDPNYLIKKIDLYPYAADTGQTSNLTIPVDVKGDYSIYVRYDAT